MYFHAELVQLIVSRSDSELKVQRHGMKKNTLTVDPIMLQDELWMRTWKTVSKPPKSVFENWTAETEFSVFEFWGWFSSVRFDFRKLISEIFIGFRTSLLYNIQQGKSEQNKPCNWFFRCKVIFLRFRWCASCTAWSDWFRPSTNSTVTVDTHGDGECH